MGHLQHKLAHHINTGTTLSIATTPYRISTIKKDILQKELDAIMKGDFVVAESESP